ncbi:hypothetical protein ES288_A13G072600v1 [Gossypium darwinii]|nr:hypothetical protein ES288_A13G072600v1 [Gossypium darwinii]
MAPSRLKKAIGRVKDQTRIGLAKVGGTTSLSDLDVAIVKATRHEEQPADERYIREIICITSYSRAYIIACVNTMSRRLNKTKSWTVALKTLLLIHRLLNEGDPAYQQEIFFSTRRGTRILNLSDFRDTSRYRSWDFSAFVRTYALYLDEKLEYNIQDRRGEKTKTATIANENKEEENNEKESGAKSSHFRDMKTEQIFTTSQQLQQLLERFLACRPIGAAKCNRVVTVALYQIVKESFQLYYDKTEILSIFIDRLMELDLAESLQVYDIFCRQGKQFDELDNFYSWCKSVGIGRSSDYPDIEKITQKKLGLVDELMRDKKLEAKKVEDDLPKDDLEPEVKESEVVEEEDMNAIKELPALEEEVEEAPVAKGLEKEEKDESQAIVLQQVVDLLNLGDDVVSSKDQAEKFALALFDGGVSVGPPAGLGWDAFKDEADWESALIQSTSNLNHQKASLGGGFDMLMLDGMYQHGRMASQGMAATGSASSVAFGSAGRPAALALPAPPSSNGKNTSDSDPFMASLTVAPPPYVQMSDTGKKQKLLAEEQAMWEQYKRNGMQGHVGMEKLQASPYSQGGHGY